MGLLRPDSKTYMKPRSFSATHRRHNRMSTPKAIPATHIDLLERPLLAALATTLPNGTPQVTPVWFNYEDGHVQVNSAAGRLKDRAIRAKPNATLRFVLSGITKSLCSICLTNTIFSAEANQTSFKT